MTRRPKVLTVGRHKKIANNFWTQFAYWRHTGKWIAVRRHKRRGRPVMAYTRRFKV